MPATRGGRDKKVGRVRKQQQMYAQVRGAKQPPHGVVATTSLLRMSGWYPGKVPVGKDWLGRATHPWGVAQAGTRSTHHQYMYRVLHSCSQFLSLESSPLVGRADIGAGYHS
ncbi:hypothetical protein GCM10028821_27860 [Hymenobacter jeollabukensis]